MIKCCKLEELVLKYKNKDYSVYFKPKWSLAKIVKFVGPIMYNIIKTLRSAHLHVWFNLSVWCLILT